MGWLEKRKTVMHLHPDQQSENYKYFETKPDEGERTDGYYMTRETWDDFGNQPIITVTVEIGDTLNKAEI